MTYIVANSEKYEIPASLFVIFLVESIFSMAPNWDVMDALM